MGLWALYTSWRRQQQLNAMEVNEIIISVEDWTPEDRLKLLAELDRALDEYRRGEGPDGDSDDR